MNEIAKDMWDKAVANIEAAASSEDINQAICLTSYADTCLKAAEFAVMNPEIVGAQQNIYPPGYVPAPDIPLPQAPSGGPKLWGAP